MRFCVIFRECRMRRREKTCTIGDDYLNMGIGIAIPGEGGQERQPPQHTYYGFME
ncbi:hypothetical protein QC760_001267 [Botrytis cinerea]